MILIFVCNLSNSCFAILFTASVARDGLLAFLDEVGIFFGLKRISMPG